MLTEETPCKLCWRESSLQAVVGGGTWPVCRGDPRGTLGWAVKAGQ
ncbi:hypothetical protein JJQ72_16885 [Paenibacillus sp. F411]|nr:hypothetical protein [Paenibacillus sp. F411]MBO2945655.1 hypothetical protein [Paenibacillus sp. F411]